MRAEQPCGSCSFTAVGRSVPWPGHLAQASDKGELAVVAVFFNKGVGDLELKEIGLPPV